MKDIIISEELTELDCKNVQLDTKLMRMAGLHLIWNQITNSYELLSLTEPMLHCHVFCGTGLLRGITGEKLEELLEEITATFIKKDSMARVWSQVKPARNVK